MNEESKLENLRQDRTWLVAAIAGAIVLGLLLLAIFSELHKTSGSS